MVKESLNGTSIREKGSGPLRRRQVTQSGGKIEMGSEVPSVQAFILSTVRWAWAWKLLYLPRPTKEAVVELLV